jgi:sulfite exporter TauE/SafE
MFNEISLLTAWLTGFLGSAHCIGMCGGIVSILTMSLPVQIRQSFWRTLPYLLSYHTGRLISYITAGIIVSSFGAQFKPLFAFQIHLWISGIFIIALGLYLGGWWQILTWLERMGSHWWRRLAPLGQRFLPITGLMPALGLGIVWGWLPCGLVYTALALALASGTVEQGGLIMLAFGLGTLPTLFLMGTAASWLTQLTRQRWFRQLIGGLLILFGTYILLGTLADNHHHIPGAELCYF